MEQREQRALQTEFSSGRARMAAAGRTLRSGLAAMTAALTPQRPRQRAAAEQQGTDGPERQAETSAPVREVVFVISDGVFMISDGMFLTLDGLFLASDGVFMTSHGAFMTSDHVFMTSVVGGWWMVDGG